MTIFSPPPTIHLVVVTSLPFGFALMSRRGVNQTFFCENNQNSIKHLCMCASKTPNFYVWKIIGIEQRKQKYFDLLSTIPRKFTKILFVAHRPRIIKQYLRGHFSFLRQFTLKKLFATTNYVKICSPELFLQFLTHCVIEWHLQVFDTPRDPNKIISMHIEQAALQYFLKKV